MNIEIIWEFFQISIRKPKWKCIFTNFLYDLPGTFKATISTMFSVLGGAPPPLLLPLTKNAILWFSMSFSIFKVWSSRLVPEFRILNWFWILALFYSSVESTCEWRMSMEYAHLKWFQFIRWNITKNPQLKWSMLSLKVILQVFNVIFIFFYFNGAEEGITRIVKPDPSKENDSKDAYVVTE